MFDSQSHVDHIKHSFFFFPNHFLAAQIVSWLKKKKKKEK